MNRAGDHTIWYVAAFGYHNVEGKCEAIENAFASERPTQQRVTGDDTKFFEYMGLFEHPAS
jgi:hypothetical protein